MFSLFSRRGFLAAVFLVSACQVPSMEGAAGRNDTSQVKVVAHRGCWEREPENSIAAVEACASSGVDITEIDVRMTQDGELVLIHDANALRTTGVDLDIASAPYAALAALPLRSGLGGEEAELTIRHTPKLQEVLFSSYGGMLINLDVKDPAAFDSIIRALEDTKEPEAYILKTTQSPLHPAFARFDDLAGGKFMPVIHQCTPERSATLEVYCVNDPAKIISDYAGMEPYGYELIFSDLSFLTGFVDALGQSDAEIWVNVLAPGHAAGHTDALAMEDPDSHWGVIADAGATIIQTDYPAALKAYLASR